MILCILSFCSVLSEAGAQSLLHLSSTHCYLSTLLSLPLSLSFFLSPSLFQKEEAQRVTMEKMAQVNHSEYSFSKNLKNVLIG